MEWEHVPLFLAVFREGSLLRAGARLSLDVSTVSRRLDRLESDLGALLFDRSRDGTTPTAIAEDMLSHAEEMERAAVSFAAAGAKVETEVEGIVRLTAPPGIADSFIAPGLARLHARYPKLRVELDAAVGYADLTRREADIAIRTTRPASGELVTTRLVSGTSRPFGAAAYVAELGRLERLDDARWITWGRELGHIADAQWIAKHGRGVEPVFRTSHFGSQLAAARTGLGLVVTAHPAERTGLVEVRHAKSLDEAWADLPVATLWLVGHRALRHVPRVAAVWTFVSEELGDSPRPRRR